MLSRTAESLFWAARYVERADTIARKMVVGYRMTMIPSSTKDRSAEWKSILSTDDQLGTFESRYEDVSQKNVEHFLIYDSDNPNSLKNCIKAARNNGREVRTAITADVWYALNQTYLEFKDFESRPVASRPDLPSFCDWLKSRCATVRGAFINTQLNQDTADFFNLGYFVERADNTARVLDIKYHLLLPTKNMIGGEVDTYQWTTLLRGLSAYRSFHWAYHGDYSPEKIVDFLILNPACPRSLHYCINHTSLHLNRLCEAYNSYSSAQNHAMLLQDELRTERASNILITGLHEFLMRFLLNNNNLAHKIGDSFLFGDR